MKILVNSNGTYPWYCIDGVYFRGYFFFENELYSGEKAVSFFQKNKSSKQVIESIVSNLNGIYSVIIQSGSLVLLICDRLRSFPIFYTKTAGIIISDSMESIVDCFSNVIIDDLSTEEYLCSSLFVSGKETLVRDVFQVRAAELVSINIGESDFNSFEYYHFRYASTLCNKREILVKGFHNNYQSIANRMNRVLNGRTAIVPLSGGADSRMVLEMLKYVGYKNVICYTYGIKGNEESNISRIVAAHYGYPWLMVEYNKKTWANLRNDEEFKQYFNWASNMTSTAHVQDYPAVKQLKEQNLIPEDSVFIPGHSGDMIAGSHISKDYLEGKKDYQSFLGLLLNKFYPKRDKKCVISKLNTRFGDLSNCDENDVFCGESEWFNICERQAKFIVNSVRVYEFFGYEWLIPLWDYSQFDYWSKVPINMRFNRKLYFEIVDSSIRSTNTQSISKEIKSHIRDIPIINNLIRRCVRVIRYFHSQHGFEHIVPFSFYLKECLEDIPTFTVNNMLSNLYIKEINEKYSNNGQGKKNQLNS